MGEVWVADDPLLAIPVALKVLSADSLGPVGSERLLREARAAAKLKHPAIVHVLDFGTSEAGDPYLAMELLSGETMSELLAKGPLVPTAAVSLLLPILDALAIAHAHGLVHRDLKPDNLFVMRGERGRVQPKLLDFGVVQTPGAGLRLTRVGRVVGTPPYMAPEQARADASLDGRVDLWSLTVTLFELVTGKLPFAGSSVPHLLLAILEEPAPSLVGAPGVDDQLAAIIARGLSKSRDDRFPDARAMGDALAAWLLAHGVEEDACGTSLRTTWPGAAALPIVAPTWSAPSPAERPQPPAIAVPEPAPMLDLPAPSRADLPAPSRAVSSAPRALRAVSTAARARLRAPTPRTAAFVVATIALGVGLVSWTLPRVAGAASTGLAEESHEAAERELPIAIGAPVRATSTTTIIASREAAPAPPASARLARRSWF